MPQLKPQPGPQTVFLSTKADIAIYGGSAGGGKALRIDTPILTPDGFINIGDLQKEDIVYDENGQEQSVTATYDVMHGRQNYKVVFDDKSEIIADGDHEWVTYSPENKERQVTTLDILKSVETGKSGRANHKIPVTLPIEFSEKNLPIDPYMLGVWLGDGTGITGVVTNADQEIFDTLSERGFNSKKIPSSQYGHRVEGLTTTLKKNNLLGNKHIPELYLLGSIEQRLDLLHGLLDTDGSCCKDGGSVELYSTEYRLADGVKKILCSLGIKTTIRSKIPKLYGKECKTCYILKWTTAFPMFKLKRKLERQKLSGFRGTQKWRYIKSVEEVDTQPVRCISVSGPSKLYLAGYDLIPTHNSFALLLEPLRHYRNPNFAGTIFRRTSPMITNQGGLWDESEAMYSEIEGAVPRVSDLSWVFPHPDDPKKKGSRVIFKHIEHEKNKLDYQGSQIPFIGFDELTHFPESIFTYMTSRNRSAGAGFKPYIRATTNPDSDSWVRRWIDWYIGEDGLPIPERSGVIRYYININDQQIWEDSNGVSSAEALAKEYGVPVSQPLSFTFIAATIYDNKELLKKDPGYLAKLKGLPRMEQEALLGGNWDVRPEGGAYFQREWVTEVDRLPDRLTTVRYWDRAASEPSEQNPDPDWTVGLKMGRCEEGNYYIYGLERFRKKPAGVQQSIFKTARKDTISTRVCLEEDPGAAGKAEADNLSSMLSNFDVRKRRPTKDKVTRFLPFSAASENGKIYILKGTWNKVFYSELESFIGDGKGHDDIVDCCSGAYNELNSQGMNIPSNITLPTAGMTQDNMFNI